MGSSAAFGFGDALDAVDAGLVLQKIIDVVSFNLQSRVGKQRGFPVFGLGKAGIHSEEVGSPYLRFVSACSRSDFEDSNIWISHADFIVLPAAFLLEFLVAVRVRFRVFVFLYAVFRA